MPHNLQHPIVYSCPLTLGKIKHNPDTMYALKAWGCWAIVREGNCCSLSHGLPDDHDLGPKFSKHLKENFCIFSNPIPSYWIEHARQFEYVTTWFDNNYMTWPKGTGAKTGQCSQELSGACSLKVIPLS